MPSLEWIGKEKVVNHHLEVPYHVLERQYSYDEDGQKVEDNGSENMIIHGDNLLALKSLLPKYEGRISCIYIDPPYNTGNEGWIYNDNVNDPRIEKWLGEVVGKEGDDLSRHDKWLCMMYPRLKLLQRLLADDGAIFISIDKNEQANLKLICDEVFGEGNFKADISWQRNYSTRNDSKGIVNEVEHILLYRKNTNWRPKKLPRTAEMDAKYKNPDNDFMAWTSDNPFAPGARTHQGMVYAIQHPFTGELIYPTNGSCWRYQQDEMLKIMNGWCAYRLEDLHDEEKRADICRVHPEQIRKAVKAIVLARSLEESKAMAQDIYQRGQWPKFYFTKNGIGGIRRKTYLKKVGGRLPTNFWPYVEVGHTDEASKELKAIFNGKIKFETPKPTRLIQRILQIATHKDSIVLDSFAGSGTIAHAVLNMNKSDGGNRKFICIEMMDYADSITAERVKRVIHGYPTNKKDVLYDTAITTRNIKDGGDLFAEAKEIAEDAKDSYDKVEGPKVVDGHLQVIGIEKAKEQQKGTGGNFSFYELGEPLFHGELLNEEVTIDTIREYIYFMETRQSLPEEKADEPYYLGSYVGTAYYFYYEKDEATTLNREFLHTVKTKADHYVIYADRCTLSDAELAKFQITFKKIPRDIARL